MKKQLRTMALVVAWVFPAILQAGAPDAAESSALPDYETEARAFLESLMPAQSDVDKWFAGGFYRFAQYDPAIGYIHIPRVSPDEALDGSSAVYSYGNNWERTMLAGTNRMPCRINTYGNSFTSCEQVSDGESWQEVLAAHLCEPVRNYGIGGYSVYQAYLRMVQKEEVTPGDLIIFNIFEDDHFRNLIDWQRLRFGVHTKAFHPTLPHVDANPAKGTLVEHANPCPTREDVSNLCDAEWVFNRFKDSFLLKIVLAQRIGSQGPSGDRLKDRHLASALVETEGEDGKAAARSERRDIYDVIEELCVEYGMPRTIESPEQLVQTANELYEKAAFYASRRVVEMVDRYAAERGKKVVYVLSYGSGATGVGGGGMAKWLVEGKRFDAEFVKWLKDRPAPVIDMMEAHATDFARYKIDVNEYLKLHYVGHYGPLGNFFCAFAMKDAVVDFLDPKPLPYQ